MNQLAVLENVNLPALANNMGAAFAEEMDGLNFTYDRAKIPSGGGITFEIGEGDDTDAVKEITGIIVDHHPVNAYWEDSYGGGNTPPDCSSLDGKKGSKFGECSTCHFNQWGSDMASGGKACKNQRRIYILPEGATIPILLTLPPTSLKTFGNYVAKRVVAKNLRSHHVITKFSLKKVQNSSGIAYSEVVCSNTGVLNDDMRAKMDQYVPGIKEMTRNVTMEEIYETAETDYDPIG